MPKFLNNINLNGNQLVSAIVDKTGAGVDPGTPGVGQIWFNTTAGGDGQGRVKVKLSTRTITLDDQYVGSVAAGGTPNGISIGGTALAPTVSMLMASGSQVGAMSTAQYTQLNNATNAATGSTLVQRDASGNAIFNQLTINNAPVSPTDAVNKAYADALAAGFDPKASCVLGTGVALPACVYANGAAGVGATLTCSANTVLTTTLIDGTSVYAVQVGDRILVKNQVSTFQNGIYTVTNLGSVGTAPWVLTRTTDYNTATAGIGCIQQGTLTAVELGANQATLWLMTTYGAITVGTTGLVFSQIGSSQVYSAGTGLQLASTTFNILFGSSASIAVIGGGISVNSSGTANQVLLSAGTVGTAPTYGAVPLGNANAVTGTLGKANGGFGQDVSTGITANSFAASPNGASGAMSFRTIVNADLPASGITAQAWTKPTFNAQGIATSGTNLAAGDIPTLDFSKIGTGIVPTTQGGSGVNAAAFWQTPMIEKVPARVAMTTNVATGAPGATLDGIAMNAGDRVLLTGQTTTNQNGLWTWNSSGGAMTRPLDFPTTSTVHAFYGIIVEVLAGTANAGTAWYLSSTGAITIDTTAMTFTQLTTSLTSGLTGQLGITNGGTGASTAAGARTALGVPGEYTGTITGDGATTSFVVTHNLASTFAIAEITDPTANNERVYPNIQYTSNNTLTVIFGIAPTNGTVYGTRVLG